MHVPSVAGGGRSTSPTDPSSLGLAGGPPLHGAKPTPMPEASLPPGAPLVDRHRRRNLSLWLVCEAVWGFGFAFISTGALMPFYLRELGASPALIGALPAVWVLTTAGVQLVAAHRTEHMVVKKRFGVAIHYPCALAVVAMGVCAWHEETLGPGVCIAVALAMMGVVGLCIGIASPLWMAMYAKLFPQGKRGVFLGYIFVMVALSGVAGAAVAERLLSALPFPRSFAVGFLIAGPLLALSVTPILWLTEPVQHLEEARESFALFVGRLTRAARAQAGFVPFLATRGLVCLGGMGAAFYAVAAKERFNLPDERAAVFAMVALCAQMAGSLGTGAIGDRRGFRWAAPMGPLCAAVAALLALGGRGPTAYHAVFAVSGFGVGCEVVAVTNLAFEFCPREDKSAFYALVQSVAAPFAAAAPLLGGWLAQRAAAGYGLVFQLTLVANAAAALLVAWLVRDPRRAGNQGGEHDGADPAVAPDTTA
jgi:MFS family permease